MARGRKSDKPEVGLVADVPVVSASAGVFLGTLRSEFDEPSALPAVFSRLLADVEAVLAEYRTGSLDEHATAEQLQAMTLTDGNGAQWTVGATTRRWYRRPPGGSWLPTPPPAAAGDEATATIELDEALLSQMQGKAANRTALDAPSDQFAAASAAVRPAPQGASVDAVPQPDGVASVLDLQVPAAVPAVSVPPVRPAIRPADALPSGPSAPLPDGVDPVLSLDVDAAAARPVVEEPAEAPQVWEAPTGLPVDAVPLPDGVRSTLSLDLPAEPVRPVAPAPVETPRPVRARAGASLADVLDGYMATSARGTGGYGEEPSAAVTGAADLPEAPTPAPVAAAAPASQAAADDITAMLAELMNTAPTAHGDVEVEEIDFDLPPRS